MNKNRKIKLQLFTAPAGMTGTANLDVRVRELDFVTSFGKNIKALLDVLGISRAVEKPNGTALKTKKVVGVLEDGHVAEGEEIPASQYKVVEEIFDSIELEKYRKTVSIEAIAEKGYDVAINDTDEELKADLQKNVTNKFYKQLKAGSLTGYESTFQLALAMAIGRVVDAFDKMGRTSTGVVAFVNTLDVARYLGTTSVTVQTAFGLKYVKDFLGADVVIITSMIPEKTVIATPMNNLVAYYVNPANAEFAKSGLSYTTDSTTGFIGFHAQGTYERAVSDMFAIMGLRVFCEYQNAIAVINIGGSSTQELGKLTVKSVAGKKTGDSKITITEQLQSPNNTFRCKTNASNAINVTCGMDVSTWSEMKSGDEIEVTTGHHVTVVEADPAKKAVASGDVVAKAK